MKEQYEFRLFEKEAVKFLRADEGRRLSPLARLVRTTPHEPLFAKIRLVHLNLQGTGRHLIASWSISRRYSEAELSSADWLTAFASKTFEPVGEECGTQYDETSACRYCGFGGRQASSLRLNLNKVPASVDVARTLAGEIVVSERFAQMARASVLSGATLDEVVHQGGRRRDPTLWYQLAPATAEVAISPAAHFGVDPFDESGDGQYRCPLGHVLGLRRTSELVVRRSSLGSEDVQATKSAAGVRSGVLRPERFLLVSQNARRLFLSSAIKGLVFEVVRISDE